jgi:type II secretory pathway pseudopilin PulG
MIIESLLLKVGLIAGLLATIFSIGYVKGKKKQQTTQLKQGVKDALKSKQRQAKRRNDSDATITQRMRKYTRR